MKCFTGVVVVAFLMSIAFHGGVCGELVPVIIFNDGTDEEGKTCSPDEWDLVEQTLDNAVGVVPSDRQRSLNRYYNNDPCSVRHAYAVGRRCTNQNRRMLNGAADVDPLDILQRGGSGLRRHRRANMMDHNNNNNNSNETMLSSCNNELNKLVLALDQLQRTLSTSCRALVSARAPSCKEGVSCDITHFALWNADTNIKIIDPFPVIGATICGNMNVTFQAVTKFAIGTVQFWSRGPKGKEQTRNEMLAPYFMHGNHNDDVYGMKFPLGNHTIKATSENNPAKAKTISFRVVKC